MEDIKTTKSEAFALRVISLYQNLTKEQNEFVMSKQVLRSGTSIGANIAEANCAESNDDFVHKLSISQKEASETIYWLKLLYRGGYINLETFQSLLDDCQEILKILSAIIVRIKRKKNN